MIEDGLRALLVNDDGVGGITGQRVSWALAPQDYSNTAHIVLLNISSNYIGTFEGVSELRMMRIQVDCYAPTFASLMALTAAVHSLLDGYTGVLPDTDQTYVQNSMPNQDVDSFEPDLSLCRRITDFNVWFDNDTQSSGGGGRQPALRIVTADYTLVPTDVTVLVNSADDTTITLITNNVSVGQTFRIKSINTGVVTIRSTHGTVEGAASITLNLESQSVDLAFDGTNYWIL